MASLEDLDRRVTALERAAERDRSVERAVAEIVAESERRTMGEMGEMKREMKRLTEHVAAAEQRMAKRAEAAERRMVDILNERFDAVMTAIDRLRP
jgi:hypothetical protein